MKALYFRFVGGGGGSPRLALAGTSYAGILEGGFTHVTPSRVETLGEFVIVFVDWEDVGGRQLPNQRQAHGHYGHCASGPCHCHCPFHRNPFP